MTNINFKSIRFNLFLLVVLTFIPLFILILENANNQKKRVHHEVKDNLRNISRHLFEQQKFIEGNTFQLLSVLGQFPEFKNCDTAKMNRMLHSLIIQNPTYAAILVVNPQGKMVASSMSYGNINVSDRKYFKDILQSHRFSIGEYSMDRLTQKPVIHYAYPIFNKDSSLVSIIIASFDLQNYDEFLKTTSLGKDVVYTFTDFNGTVIYKSPNDFKSIGNKESAIIFDHLKGIESEGSFSAKDNDDIEKVYSCHRLSVFPNETYMYIYAGMPEKIAFAEYHKQLSQNMFLWLITALFVAGCAYFFSFKYIIHPLDKMVETAKKIADGNLEVQTGFGKSSNELGKLAKAMDIMANKLFQRDSETKQVEKDLKKLKERFELAINSAKIGIWDWHLRTNSLIWDKNMFELYGLNPNEFGYDYDSWMVSIHPEDINHIQEEIRISLETFIPFRSEYRIIHPVTGIKHIRIFASPIKDKEGKPARLIGINMDISERKLWERKLNEAKEKAEKSDRLKSVFFADISHEIRTPLHGIIGFAQILKDNEITYQERIQYLDIIINSGHKLLNIISNIIDISLLDAGQLKLIVNECDITEINTDVYKYYDRLSQKEKKPFQFSLEVPTRKPLWILVDGFRLNQIYGVLIESILRISKKGMITMGYKVTEEHICCFVKTSDIIIDDERLENLFDKFKSLEDICGKSYGDNALNLVVCKGLIELMGGSMWANNLEGQTEFIFNIPYHPIENKVKLIEENSDLV